MSHASAARRERIAAKRVAQKKDWGDWRIVEVTDDLRRQYPFLEHCEAIWMNNRYEVQQYNCTSAIGGIVQLNIRRHFDVEEITWGELQRIKNELFGEQVCGVEMFPPEAVKWNPESNVRVLWLMPTSGWSLPFGLHLPTSWGRKENHG